VAGRPAKVEGSRFRVTHIPETLITPTSTLVSLSLRRKDLLGPVTRVKKKKTSEVDMVGAHVEVVVEVLLDAFFALGHVADALSVGFEAHDLGFRAYNLGFRVYGSWCMV